MSMTPSPVWLCRSLTYTCHIQCARARFYIFTYFSSISRTENKLNIWRCDVITPSLYTHIDSNFSHKKIRKQERKYALNVYIFCRKENSFMLCENL